jgi:hypothetical protein
VREGVGIMEASAIERKKERKGERERDGRER